MLVKEFLKKLDVPLNLLRLLAGKVKVDIKNEKQLLIPIEVSRLQKLALQDDFSDLVSEVKEKYNKAISDAYTDGIDRYFIGLVKWFSGADGSEDYGFVQINAIGDVYFNRKHIYISNSEDFKENQIVFIRIPEKELSLSKRLGASRVNFLKDEENIAFMVHLKINDEISQSKKIRLDILLQAKLANLDKNQRTLLGLYIDTIPPDKFDPEQLDFYRNLYDTAEKMMSGSSLIEGLEDNQKFKLWLKDANLISFHEVKEEMVSRLSSQVGEWDSLQSQNQQTREALFAEALEQLHLNDGSINEYLFLYKNTLKYRVSLGYRSTPKDVVYQLWADTDFDIPIAMVQDHLADKLSDDSIVDLPKALKNESEENQQLAFELALERLLQRNKVAEQTLYLQFKTLFSRAHDLKLSLLTEKLDDVIAHQLWREGFSNRPIIIELYKEYWQYFEASSNRRVADDATILQKQFPVDLERLTDEEISNLLTAHFYDLDTIGKQAYDFFKALLGLDISKTNRDKLIHTLEKKSDSFGKLRLFVDDYSDTIDYDDAVLYTALLHSDEQKLFFKKCLSLIENGKAFWTLSDFNRILAVDYELYAQAESIGEYDLDFSLKMILHIAAQVEKGERINQQSIFEIVAGLINDPRELLKITGFLDKCHGRQSLKVIKNSDPEQYEQFNYKDSNPRFANYCEGRKAVDVNTREPTISKKSGKGFYWCENATCHNIARKPHSVDDWRNYSLADVFRILDISFSENEYEQLVGTINKANNFFEHLNCRDCGHILHPSGKDNYGLYRVSNFCCKNSDCDTNENIYLSHCANGRCLDIVDSRDSVLCKSEGHGDNCGWYVCNNCHACCTTRNVQARAYRLAQMGQERQCPQEGHRERQKICCNKCGTEMEEQSANYENVLKWLLDKKDTHPCITKSDTNQYGRLWFIWQQGTFTSEKFRETVVNFRRSGFNIPDFEEVNRRSYLIAEPRYRTAGKMYYKCPECMNELIITSDVLPADQYTAIKKYHFELKKV